MATPIGPRLKKIREERGMTQKQLAASASIRQSTISEIERGASASASAENLLILASLLKTNPQWLLTGEGDENLPSFSPNDTEVMTLAASLPADKKAAWIAAGQALLNSK